MNGRAARQLRANGRFEPSDRAFAEVRRSLFGDRFKGGFGLKDPAYMPLYPHEAADYMFSQGRKMWDRFHSAADLEKFIDQAPAIEQLGPNGGGEQWYDDSARLVAKWVTGRIFMVPQERELRATFWEVMSSAFPHIPRLGLSTLQLDWARSAALRIIDAYRADGSI
jgi:hypothetical protein